MDDYNIFFATQQVESVNNRGEKVYVKDAGGKILRDAHGHFIVAHDLFNHDGLTKDGVAEAFAEFAKKERLSFFSLSPFDSAKFEALLKGLEIPIVRLSDAWEINPSIRLDPDFFSVCLECW